MRKNLFLSIAALLLLLLSAGNCAADDAEKPCERETPGVKHRPLATYTANGVWAHEADTVDVGFHVPYNFLVTSKAVNEFTAKGDLGSVRLLKYKREENESDLLLGIRILRGICEDIKADESLQMTERYDYEVKLGAWAFQAHIKIDDIRWDIVIIDKGGWAIVLVYETCFHCVCPWKDNKYPSISVRNWYNTATLDVTLSPRI